MSDQKSPVNSDAADQTAETLSLQKSLTRRTLLKIGGTIATAAVAAPILAACGDATATTAPASTTAPAAGATTAARAATWRCYNRRWGFQRVLLVRGRHPPGLLGHRPQL